MIDDEKNSTNNYDLDNRLLLSADRVELLTISTIFRYIRKA